MKLLKIKPEIKTKNKKRKRQMIILIRNMHISKNISDNTNKIKSQDFGISTAKIS